MRNIAILGASALVLALGVAQASANNSVLDYRAAAAAQAEATQPAYTGELRDYGSLPVSQYASQAPNQAEFDQNARSSTTH